MTSDKHLEAAARARTVRAAERYTTAHRHLVGERSIPAGAAPGYRSFGGGRHHGSALLTHLLEAAGDACAALREVVG